jgi:ribose transport system permease protein
MMTTDVEAASGTTQSRRDYSFLFALSLLGILLVLWVALSFATRTFMTPLNITNLLRQGSMISILALGETFVIITAGIDLSVGAIAGFCTVIVAMLLQAGVPIWLSVFLTLLSGLAIGMFHAFGVTRMRVPPFIMTLASLTSLRGIGLLMTQGAPVNITVKPFTDFSIEEFLGIPSLFWMVLLVGIPSYIFLSHTRWGRYIFAVGSNPESARLSGVRINFTLYIAYSFSAVLAAFVGVLLAMRIGIGNAMQADAWELQAIASSVIGGTSLFGAIGSVHGPMIGAFILATINNGANLLNVNSFWQRTVTGLLIIVIVYFDGLRRQKI